MLKLIHILMAIGQAINAAKKKQREIDLAEQRAGEIRDRRLRDLAEAESRQAILQNKVVLGDIQIEKARLELEEVEKRVNPPGFDPINPP